MKGIKGLVFSALLLTAGAEVMASEIGTPIDSIPSGFRKKPEWRVGATVAPAYVIPTDPFYRGSNYQREKITASLSEDVSASFAFAPDTKEGILYPGIYQGAGLGIRTYFNYNLMGRPSTFYLFQGAPFAHFGSRFHLGYEWKFGVAFGWHHTSYEDIEFAAAISTAITAHMGVALKMSYDVNDHWMLSLALEGTHFSNGNTSWRNGGLNSVGLSAGVTYIINPLKAEKEIDATLLKKEADKGRWFYDIMAYGAWRLRTLQVYNRQEVVDWNGIVSYEGLAPGHYGVAGIMFSPLRSLNHWIAVGPAVEAKWDGSAAMTTKWFPTDDPEVYDLKFYKPSFGHQISVGVSAHAELTTPIFAINAGLGFNVINPKGDKRFYQNLTFKAFLTRNLFMNIGYSLGDFKTPNHLMLGLGVRIY